MIPEGGSRGLVRSRFVPSSAVVPGQLRARLDGFVDGDGQVRFELTHLTDESGHIAETRQQALLAFGVQRGVIARFDRVEAQCAHVLLLSMSGTRPVSSVSRASWLPSWPVSRWHWSIT